MLANVDVLKLYTSTTLKQQGYLKTQRFGGFQFHANFEWKSSFTPFDILKCLKHDLMLLIGIFESSYL